MGNPLNGGSCAPVLELEFRNCFWVQKTEFRRRPLQIALPAVAYESRPLQIALPAVANEFRKLSSAVGHRLTGSGCELKNSFWTLTLKQVNKNHPEWLIAVWQGRFLGLSRGGVYESDITKVVYFPQQCSAATVMSCASQSEKYKKVRKEF